MSGRRRAGGDVFVRSLLVLSLASGGIAALAVADHARSGHVVVAPGRVAAGPEITADPGADAPSPEESASPIDAQPAPAPSPAMGLAGAQAGAATASYQEDAVVALTNQQRLAAGCPRLRWDATLARAAERHARDMIGRDYFEHVSPSGLSPLDRARALGFEGGVGENLAVGYPTAGEVVAGWMNSPGHRANILNCRFSLIGVSYLDGTIPSKNARGVWAQEFGTSPTGG
jgi:uncharacterized protein YkwD